MHPSLFHVYNVVIMFMRLLVKIQSQTAGLSELVLFMNPTTTGKKKKEDTLLFGENQANVVTSFWFELRDTRGAH